MNTRKDFLMRLRYRMIRRFSLREIRDTLEDFNGFFDEGIREGKTEEELCLSFGAPREIVRQMSAGKRRISLHMLLALLAAAACAFCLWQMAAAPRSVQAFGSVFAIPVFAAGAALLLADGGILFTMEAAEDISFCRLAIRRLCSLIPAAGLIFFCLKGVLWIAASAEPSIAGILAGNACRLFAACGAAFALYSAHSFFHGNPYAIGSALLGMGILCSSCAMQEFLHRLDAMPVPAGNAFLPCALGILLSLLCDGAVLTASQIRRDLWTHR